MTDQCALNVTVADFDSITPTCCRIGSGDELQIRGSGFISAPQVCVRIRHEGGEAVVPAAVQNPTLITLPMPSLPLRIATTPDSPVADSEGDGQEGDGTAAEPAAAGSEAPSAPEEETDHAEAVTAATSELASGNVSCFAEVSFDGGATYAGGDVLCPFVVYKGQLADAVQPKTCPLGGGVTLSIAEADPADPWLFDSGSAVVYIENKSFAAEVPLAIDPDSHAIQFKMPALERNKYGMWMCGMAGHERAGRGNQGRLRQSTPPTTHLRCRLCASRRPSGRCAAHYGHNRGRGREWWGRR